MMTNCAICDGVGWVMEPVAPGYVGSRPAVPCVCLIRLREDRERSRMRSYGNTADISRFTMANFDATTKKAEYQKEHARKFIDQRRGFLLFHGETGKGKTHLAAAIANDLAEGREPATLFVVIPDLLLRLQGLFKGDSDPYERVVEQIRSTPVLILDDLGAEQQTPWREEVVYLIINHRYNQALPTVLTTNLPKEKHNGRIRSRIYSNISTIVNF